MAGTAAVTRFQSISKAVGNGTEILHSRTQDILPISPDERKERVVRAQHLMLQNNIAALVIEGGTSLEYFTGISWWLSERTMVAVIPAKGEIIYVCPGFEESRFRELITIGKQVLVWQEDESPYDQIAHAFSEAGISAGNIGSAYKASVKNYYLPTKTTQTNNSRTSLMIVRRVSRYW